MEQGIISKNELKRLIISFMKSYKVYGPVKGSDGVSLSELTADSEIVLDYPNFKLSPKSIFFPQCEVIGSYDGDILCDVSPPEESYIIFGIRPCDAKALTHLDHVFYDSDSKDPYYLRKRENTVIITLACNTPLTTCFCTAFGGSPSGREGADIVMFDVEGSLLFEICSDKGRTFLKEYSTLFRDAKKADLTARDKQVSLAEGKVPAIDITGLKEKLSGGFDSPVWETISQRCLGCGICTYICPTCHCFAIFDEKVGSEGTRIRTWDSCQYPAFTLEASGHNPRTSNTERMRQRIMHKFDYFIENYGETACVGCGRCVGNCPVNLDIRETLSIIVSEKS